MSSEEMLNIIENIINDPSNNLTNKAEEKLKTIMLNIKLIDCGFDLNYFNRLVEFVETADANGKDISIAEMSDNPEKFIFHAKLIESAGTIENEIRINEDGKSFHITDNLPF